MRTRRLFFALWLPAPVARALHRQAKTLVAAGGGRAMRAETLHLTLVFLGDIDEARLPELMAIGAGVAADRPAFALAIDRLGRWGHNRIDWAGCSSVPPPLESLVGDLRGALAEDGFTFEARAFAPHVTLVRRRPAGDLPADFAPLPMPVDELRLVESLRAPQGAGYAPVGRWPLTTTLLR